MKASVEKLKAHALCEFNIIETINMMRRCLRKPLAQIFDQEYTDDDVVVIVKRYTFVWL